MTVLLASLLMARAQVPTAIVVVGRPKTVEALRLPPEIATAESTLERAKFLRVDGQPVVWIDPQLVRSPEIVAANESLKLALRQGVSKVASMSSLPEKERQALRRTIMAGPIAGALTRKGSQGDAVGFGLVLDVELDGKRYQAHMRPSPSDVPPVPDERKRAATPPEPGDEPTPSDTVYMIRLARSVPGDIEIAMQRVAQQAVLNLRKKEIEALRKEADRVRRELLAEMGSPDLPWGEAMAFDDLAPGLKSKVRELLLQYDDKLVLDGKQINVRNGHMMIHLYGIGPVNGMVSDESFAISMIGR